MHINESNFGFSYDYDCIILFDATMIWSFLQTGHHATNKLVFSSNHTY